MYKTCFTLYMDPKIFKTARTTSYNLILGATEIILLTKIYIQVRRTKIFLHILAKVFGRLSKTFTNLPLLLISCGH